MAPKWSEDNPFPFGSLRASVDVGSAKSLDFVGQMLTSIPAELLLDKLCKAISSLTPKLQHQGER